MANLNKVMLIGNLTRDPEVRYTPKGTAVGELGLAVNRRVSDGSGNWTDETTFVDITLWGNNAENAQKYLVKGRSVFIEGRLQLDSWEDKQSGQKRTKLKVVAEVLQFLNDGKGAQGGGASQGGAPSAGYTQRPPQQSGPARQSPAPQGGSAADDSDFVDDDDIPF